ncbi:hypothetical protein AVEN_253174-1 [Araneus ventricosus]|uniref:Uncharacterized protein n=1 Tax=Araneus ventricosus TaxID=182803 RepID=A0A4Y2P0Z9_ARAVE|nr:hypothetical protein AVEN_253174-1 [Araneus ventricosus]
MPYIAMDVNRCADARTTENFARFPLPAYDFNKYMKSALYLNCQKQWDLQTENKLQSDKKFMSTEKGEGSYGEMKISTSLTISTPFEKNLFHLDLINLSHLDGKKRNPILQRLPVEQTRFTHNYLCRRTLPEMWTSNIDYPDFEPKLLQHFKANFVTLTELQEKDSHIQLFTFNFVRF